jgi:RyR domain
MELTNEQIAQIAHETNRVYCRIIGDNTQPLWHEAPARQRDSAINGVTFVRANPNAGPAAQHDNWMAEKQRDGWTYGPIKDVDAKTHPCFLPHDQLPPEQQRKDHLFHAVVTALSTPMPTAIT